MPAPCQNIELSILERALCELLPLAEKAGVSDFEIVDWAAHLGELHQLTDADGLQTMIAAAIDNVTNSRASRLDGRAEPTPGGWRHPQPLPKGLPPVDDFDLQFLPAALQEWVADISARLQCPPDYVGITAVVGLGSLIGRRVGIKPQQKTDWLETPNIWGGFIGRPGMLKSCHCRSCTLA